MNDKILLENVRKDLEMICKENCIGKVNKLQISVDADSHVDKENLKKHLTISNKTLVGDWTEIIIDRKQNLEGETAIIESVSGKFLEQ